MALQLPAVVLQVPTTEPAFAVKFTVVPSGTGFLKWFASRAVNTVVVPSTDHPSILCWVADSEKPNWSGMPVVMESWLDWVVSVVPAVAPGVDAVTRTGVLTVPEFTVATTSPDESEMPVFDANERPPTVVLSPKVTVFPLIGLPPVSRTLNVTSEVGTPPLPFNEIFVGLAETYWIEPVVGGMIVSGAEEEARPPLTEAVTVSVPAQPLSRYDPVATPFTVTTLPKTALPLAEQPEEKVTVCGMVTATPPLDTVTLTLVVPKAESAAGLTPKAGAETVTVEAPME